mmetsp:Transcript_10341/g.21760  ORF Transcript_10341/g.21760 Transcript_10341/m.21760 type:complete len:188 (-) Transcript_10341:334-897(-)
MEPPTAFVAGGVVVGRRSVICAGEWTTGSRAGSGGANIARAARMRRCQRSMVRMVTAREVAREYEGRFTSCRVTVKYYRFKPDPLGVKDSPTSSPYYPRHHFIEVEAQNGEHMRQFHWRPGDNLCWQHNRNEHEREVEVFHDVDPKELAEAICDVSDRLNIWSPHNDCNVWTEEVIRGLGYSRKYFK